MRYPPPIHLTVSTLFLFLSMLVTLPADAQEAYFSFTGEIVNIGDEQGFDIDFNRNVVTAGPDAENVSFRTWNYSGGTNAAGDTIAANAFDTLLAFDINGTTFENDDSGTGFDA